MGVQLLKNIAYCAVLICFVSIVYGAVEMERSSYSLSVLTNANKMRCTRRFSPGVCSEPLAPVWTFVFQLQNCSERLGCVYNYRSNCFRKYRMCMRRCRPLIDMYLRMLEFEEQNRTHLRQRGESARRTSIGVSTAESLEDDDEAYDETGGVWPIGMVYKDTKDVSGDIQPPDIDLVRGDIVAEYDLFH